MGRRDNFPERRGRKADAVLRAEGGNPEGAMASLEGPTGVRERGMDRQGQLGNLGAPSVSLSDKPEEQGYRLIKSPGVE